MNEFEFSQFFQTIDRKRLFFNIKNLIYFNFVKTTMKWIAHCATYVKKKKYLNSELMKVSSKSDCGCLLMNLALRFNLALPRHPREFPQHLVDGIRLVIGCTRSSSRKTACGIGRSHIDYADHLQDGSLTRSSWRGLVVDCCWSGFAGYD